jgi:hypothetical protein
MALDDGWEDTAEQAVNLCSAQLDVLVEMDLDSDGADAGRGALNICQESYTTLAVLYLDSAIEDEPVLEFYLASTYLMMAFSQIYIEGGDVNRNVCEYALGAFETLVSLIASDNEIVADQALTMAADESTSWLFVDCNEKFPDLLESE